MTKKLAFLFLAAAACPAAAALTFDSTTDGFTIQANATALGQSAVNGGSLQMTANGGWAGNGASVDLRSSNLWTDMQAAGANGGTLSFDVIVVGGSQTLTGNPGWFEVVAVANSTNSGSGGTGGWDQEVLGIGLSSTSWPISGTYSYTVSVPILAAADLSGNGGLYWDTVTPGWTELVLGLNNDGGAVTQAVVNFDNFRVTANPVPEPSAAGLGLLTVAALAGSRRRPVRK